MKNQTEMTWGDLFAGEGGTTTGALSVKGVRVLWALNHSKEAIYTHKINHPETEHYRADIRDMDEHKLCEIDGLWASLECTNFSNAKGGRPKNEDSRTLAWELIRYIIHSIKSEYDIRRSKTKPGRDHVVTREVQEISRSSDKLFNSRGLFQKNQDLN